MRKYKFEFKSNDDPDFPEYVKFSNKFESYLDEGETDIDEFIHETKHFLLARGFHRHSVDGVVFIHWDFYKKPEYTGEYLVTIKDEEYATTAKYDADENKWNIDEDDIVAWAEMPIGVGHEC